MSQPDLPTRSTVLPLGRWDATGPLLLLISAVAFSTAGFFARSVSVDAATMLFWRNLLGALIMAPFVIRTIHAVTLTLSPRVIAIVGLSAFGSICYLAAFSFTSVANVAIIYGAAPVMTALIAWVGLRERMQVRTVAAVVAAFLGVALTSLGGGLEHGSLIGDGLALLMTSALSAVAVLSRGRSFSPVPIACGSSLVAGLAILPAQPVLHLSMVQFMWLAAFGGITMAVAFPCYLLGLRSVPAGRAMLISALELPLGPLWVWAAYGERITVNALLGGAIVCGAVLWDLSAHSR